MIEEERERGVPPAARGGDVPTVPEGGHTVEERYEGRILMTLADDPNERLARILAEVDADDDLYGLWLAANVNAMERLGMTDHGPVHVKIVMQTAVRLLRILIRGGIEPSLKANYDLDVEDAEVVVALGALLHDVGMSIHRDSHEAYSLFVAQEKLRTILAPVYDVRRAAVMRSEILHAIIAHRTGSRPLTVEAGVVRVADALDMAKGRSRIPFASGSLSIHSVSAAAIEAVTIEAGEERPITVTVDMSNSAGLFQLDQLLREKIKGSGLESLIEVKARLGDQEKPLISDFTL